MKKYFLLTLISFALYGCSSIELEAVSTSAEETQRILAMGLSHEENLIEAKKLKSDLMISVVTLQLTNAKDEKIQAEIDKVESNKFSDLVNVSESEKLKNKFVNSQYANKNRASRRYSRIGNRIRKE